jgi:Rha family phage regulatory protein
MDLITTPHGEPMTTSLVIAEKFGKRHGTVLRAIRNLDCPAYFNARNFVSVEYLDAKGERRPYYEITRDGFAFLAMGFTGKEAAAWKIKFLEAFNAMERTLRQQDANRLSFEWKQARESGKVVRLTFTNNVQDFVAYAKAQGSRNAEKYYMALTKMEYQALFMIGQAVGKDFRDRLNAHQLVNLGTAELVAQRAIREGMEANLYYKAIYQLAKHKVETFASMVGKSLPGERLPQLRRAA